MYHHKYRLILPFVVPGLLMYGLFVLWPYTQALYVALTDWSGMTPEKNFIGLDNFTRLFRDDKFWNALRHNIQFLIVSSALVPPDSHSSSALWINASYRSAFPNG